MELKMRQSDEGIREKFHNLVEGENSQSEWDPVISIGTVAKKVGLSISALRKYEKEGLLIYYRTPTGRRLLALADIKRVKIIQHLINDLGLNMEGIRRLLALLPCWRLKPCSDEEKQNCEAVSNARQPCWMVKETECARRGLDCRLCNVYRFGAYCTEAMKSLLLNLYEPPEIQAGDK
jgi:MerR family transcriptional regulator/heat shock protein HspR